MKKAELWNRRLSLKAGSILLTAALVAGSCSAAVMAADSTGETAEATASEAASTAETAASEAASTAETAASEAASTAEAVSGAESAAEDGDDSYELLTDDEAAELALGSDEAGEDDVLDMSDFAYELSPEGEEMQEYVEENYTPDLVNTYGSIRYDQVVWNEKGEETDETGYIYRDKDLIVSEFIDGYK